jgi:hypothetical protein
LDAGFRPASTWSGNHQVPLLGPVWVKRGAFWNFDDCEICEGKASQMNLGIFEGLSHSEYHQTDAASHSRLCDMRRSLAYCRYRIDNPEQTEAMAFGEALHALCLGGWDGHFAVAPSCDRRTKAGRINYELFERSAAGRTIIRGEDSDTLNAMHSGIISHPTAERLIFGDDARSELSGFWRDDEHGILCKLRADRVVTLPGYGTVCVDLKTTKDASPEAFQRSIGRYGYHLQSAWYLHGLAKLGIPCEAFVIVAVEKDPPYGVAVYRIGDASVEQGHKECRRLLAKYVEATKTGKWGGYSEEITEIELPHWDFDEEIL